MYTSSYVYGMGYRDAKAGRAFRDAIPKESRYRAWKDDYDRGWKDARDGKPDHSMTR